MLVGAKKRLGLTLTAVLLAPACSCSSDDGGAPDAAVDAPIDGPASLKFETVCTDLVSGAAQVDVVVTEVGTANTATSAPNGRAILQLPNADSSVSHAFAGALENTMVVSQGALALHADADAPHVSEIASAADLDTLYTGLGVVRDPGTTQLILHVRNASFAPAAGVTLNVDGAAASFVRNAGAFEPGGSPIDDATVLVPNVAGASATITAPASCTGPTNVALVPGQIASAFYVCE